MTTWTNTSLVETSWGNTTPLVQIIDFIDNTYNINYNLVDINGRSIRKWNDLSLLETAWAGDQVTTTTTTHAYPIGLLLALTGNVTTVTTTNELSTNWSNSNNIETAWAEG